MPTAADQRLLELLDKWLNSLELHARYSSLDDDSYWKVQPWVEHQRPSRWIIDLATQKTRALRAQVEKRIEQEDAKFSDALELMIFLANLVGSEHIERFIPVAEAQNERSTSSAQPESSPAPDPAAASETREMPRLPTPRRADPNAVTATREMPKLPAAKRPAAPTGTSEVARTERKGAEKTAQKGQRQPAKTAATAKPTQTKPAARDQVIADAVRLAQWGRKWFEMPELIARMAGRPPLAEVRRILKESRAVIDERSK